MCLGGRKHLRFIFGAEKNKKKSPVFRGVVSSWGRRQIAEEVHPVGEKWCGWWDGEVLCVLEEDF